jgi:hypothetical protein
MHLSLHSVVAFHLWHEGDLYDNWSAAGLAMSDNAKLQTIADSICQAYNVGLEDIQGTCLLQLHKRALSKNGHVSPLGTTLVPIHLQSVGALAPTPPKQQCPFPPHHSWCGFGGPSTCAHPCHIGSHQGRTCASHICRLCETQSSHTDARWLELTVPVQKVHWIELPDSIPEEGHPPCPDPCQKWAMNA